MSKNASPKPHRVNLRDIALAAGMSVGSISSVLNNRYLERRITHDTAERIRAIAARLGYLPNINARRLRSNEGVKNSILLALITSFEAPIPLVNHFVAAVHRASEGAMAARLGCTFSLMIEMYSAGHLGDLSGLLTGDRFNAAIILNTIPEDDQFLIRTHLPYPVVLVNRSLAGYRCVTESPDCGSRAAERLAAQKRSRLAVLHGKPLTQTTQNRFTSFMRRALELTGRPAVEIIANKLSEEGGYAAMKRYLQDEPDCNGLYTVSDALALGAYQAIKEQGLRIPKDISVIGVGDYDIAPFFDPPLSSVGVSHRKLAEQACQLLFKQLNGDTSPAQLIIPTHEVLRASSGH